MLKRLLLVVAVLSLLTQCLGAVVAAWTCEGRTCSTALSSCCCADNVELRDGRCVSAGRQRACSGKCSCKLTVRASNAPFAAAAEHGPRTPNLSEMPAILPATFDLPSPSILAFVPTLANPPPKVGPPPLLKGAPLRAPPFSFV